MGALPRAGDLIRVADLEMNESNSSRLEKAISRVTKHSASLKFTRVPGTKGVGVHRADRCWLEIAGPWLYPAFPRNGQENPGLPGT